MTATCLDIFAGAGGASLGLHRAGFRHLACAEWDPDACTTLEAAREAGILDPGDVLQGDVREADWGPYAGRVDLLWASPPCQAWSSAGKRLGAADERNGWPWTLDMIDALQPGWVIAENVPGLLHHRADCTCPGGDPDDCPGGYFERFIVPEMERRFLWVEWRVLNASSFGVPQHRRRVILVAGPRPIRWPSPTHDDPTRCLLTGRRPWRTVREALGLGLETIGQTSPDSGRGGNKWRSADEPAPTIPALTTSGGWNGIQARNERHPPATPDAPAPGIRSSGCGHSAPPMWLREEDTGARGRPDTEPAPTVSHAGTLYGYDEDPGVRRPALAATEPWRLDMPSPAVLSTEDKGARHQGNATADRTCARASDALWRATGRRRLTVEECAVLQDFPPGYPFQGTKTSRYRHVGNAVPPTLAEVVGAAVIAAVGEVAA